jgi:hypothetical protein
MKTVMEWRYSSTVPKCYDPAALPLEMAPGTHWVGGWVGPRAGPDAMKRKASPCRAGNADWQEVLTVNVPCWLEGERQAYIFAERGQCNSCLTNQENVLKMVSMKCPPDKNETHISCVEHTSVCVQTHLFSSIDSSHRRMSSIFNVKNSHLISLLALYWKY